MGRQRPFLSIWRFFRWQIESRLFDEVIFEWIAESKLAVSRGMTGATGNIYVGLHEYVDMSFLIHVLRSGDTFVDVGANVGSYTVLAAAACEANVISIEPDSQAQLALNRNIEINAIAGRVRVVSTAVGEHVGHVDFTVGLDTTNQVIDVTNPKRKLSRETRTVTLTPLDDVVGKEQPQLLKIDIEGYELCAFKGANRTLSSERLFAIISEGCGEAEVELLSSYGFRRLYYNPHSRKLVESAEGYQSQNAIFVKEKRILEVISRVESAGGFVFEDSAY